MAKSKILLVEEAVARLAKPPKRLKVAKAVAEPAPKKPARSAKGRLAAENERLQAEHAAEIDRLKAELAAARSRGGRARGDGRCGCPAQYPEPPQL